MLNSENFLRKITMDVLNQLRNFSRNFSNLDFHSIEYRELKSLKGINFSRYLLVSKFLEMVNSHFHKQDYMSIALVGGSELDPEIQALLNLGYDIKISKFGIENSDHHFDLNVENSDFGQFDLVICSQVLEHVWNIERSLINLSSLVNQEGYIWISVPTSNRRHASPEYFSAGYTSKFITENLARFGILDVSSGDFGSKREYLARHMLPVWLTSRGHKFPLLFAFEERNFIKRSVLTLIYLPHLVFLHLCSTRVKTNSRFSSETWVLGIKATHSIQKVD